MIADCIDFTWRDCIEILFFSSICYYFTCWIAKDRQKNLLLYFYGYWAIAGISYYADFSTITFFLFASFPIIAILFIIMHQEILQKNFIALHNITAQASRTPLHWHEILVRSCLVLLHKQQSVCCIIEQKQSLAEFVQTSFIFDTPIQHGLLELLISRENNKNKNSFIWLTSAGVIKSFDCTWIPSTLIDDASESTISYWYENAVFFTSKTDAFILSSNHSQGTFSCIVQGKQIEGLTADQAIRMLHKYTLSRECKKGSTPHAPTTQKNHSQRSCP